MKKHLSVLGLFARGSIYKVLLILALTVAFEVLLFVYNFEAALSDYHASVGTGLESMRDLEGIIDASALPWCFAASVILTTVVLCIVGCEFSSKTGYTLRRLSIDERFTFLYQALYNTAVYAIVFCTQITVAYMLCAYYADCAPSEFTGSQTVFLAFYRNEFLHALLPLSDISLWVRNACLLIGFGVCTALFPFKQRRRGFAISVPSLVVSGLIFFRCGIGETLGCVFYSLFALVLAAYAIYSVVNAETTDRREEFISESDR